MANKNIYLDNFCTKERSTNFHRVEVERLQNLIEKYKHILLCKKTDATSSKQKEYTWNCIEKEFNAVGETPRSIKQLKYKFDNMKRTVKKEASKERQQMIKTGGGRLTPPPPLSPRQENDVTRNDWLRTILSTSVDGNEAVYDDDITAKVNYPLAGDSQEMMTFEPILCRMPVSIKPSKPHQEVIQPLDTAKEFPEATQETPTTIVTPAKLKEVEGTLCENVFDTSTPHTSLKRPMSSPLRRLAKKKNDTNCGITRSALREKKINVLNELQELELQKIKESITHQRELHNQEIRHKEEKHNMEIIKLQLEIDILQSKKDETNKIN